MFYKYNEEQNEWHSGLIIHFPNEFILTMDNKEVEYEGWKWYDESPVPNEDVDTHLDLQ